MSEFEEELVRAVGYALNGPGHPHEDFVQCGAKQPGTERECVERDARIQGGECGEEWCEVC